jgi:hypothetical protein
MVVIGEVQVVSYAQRIGFIDTQAEHCSQREAHCGRDCNDRERGSIRTRGMGRAVAESGVREKTRSRGQRG